MKLVVGLGNPGEKYQNNRHNVGFVVVERLLAEITKHQAPSTKQILITKFETNKRLHAEIFRESNYILAKPTTYMNESGRAVAAIARFYKLKSEDIYVIHDDLDITLGSYKIAKAKGPQVHNGLLSIYQDLGTRDFWHIRVGVENREVKGNKGVPGMVYSLQDFTQAEHTIIKPVIEQVTVELKTIIG